MEHDESLGNLNRCKIHFMYVIEADVVNLSKVFQNFYIYIYIIPDALLHTTCTLRKKQFLESFKEN